MAARRAAEAKMAQRDRMERTGRRGARAARRSRYEFVDAGDELDGGLDISTIPRRTRRQYDERRDMDDLDGIEDVFHPLYSPNAHADYFALQEIPLEQLSDIKAKSIAEWIANDRVRRSIVRHFRQFLMTYVDEHGASVYGQRIRNLGEGKSYNVLNKACIDTVRRKPTPNRLKYPIYIWRSLNLFLPTF